MVRVSRVSTEPCGGHLKTSVPGGSGVRGAEPRNKPALVGIVPTVPGRHVEIAKKPSPEIRFDFLLDDEEEAMGITDDGIPNERIANKMGVLMSPVPTSC